MDFYFGPERYGVHRKHRRIDADLMPVQQILQISPSKQSEAPPDTTSATEHLDMMIRRIAMDSMTEIGRVIRELENMSEMLRNESERVIRDVSGLASLNQEAAAAKKVIAESLKQWKERPSQNKEAAKTCAIYFEGLMIIKSGDKSLERFLKNPRRRWCFWVLDLDPAFRWAGPIRCIELL